MLAGIVATTFAITACGTKKQTDDAHPKLVAYGAAQSAQLEPVANGFVDISQRITALPQQGYVGTTLSFNDTVVNQGAPSKGLRVVLKGDAFVSGKLGEPSSAILTALGKTESDPRTQMPLSFSESSDGSYIAESDVAYLENVNIAITAPIKHGGETEAVMMVYPLDKAGSTAAGFAHPFTLRSDGSDE